MKPAPPVTMIRVATKSRTFDPPFSRTVRASSQFVDHHDFDSVQVDRKKLVAERVLLGMETIVAQKIVRSTDVADESDPLPLVGSQDASVQPARIVGHADRNGVGSVAG